MSLPPAFHESLPYIDSEPSSEALAAAHALIAAEAATATPKPLPKPQEPSFTPAIATELSRISSKTPLQTLTFSRYEAQEAPAGGATPERLQEVLGNAYVSNAYLSGRRQNLELLDKHGKNAWLIGNHQLEAELKQVEKELADTKRDVDLTNIERQRRQNEVKGEMQMLEETWRKGVGKVLETELAVEELKQQIRQQMRNRGTRLPE